MRVVDAESGAPIPGAVVDLHDWPSTPDAPDPRLVRFVANAQGEMAIRRRPRRAIWQAQAAGYIEQRTWSGAGTLPPRYAAYAGSGYDGLIHLYRLPEPRLEIRVLDGYVGPLTIHLEPAPGFGYVAGDGPNVSFVAVDPRASYIQGVPGRRHLATAALDSGVVKLVVTPLFYDIQTRQVWVHDAGGVLPHRDIADRPDAGRCVWGEATQDDKTNHRRIRLFVGTLTEYQGFLHSLQKPRDL